MAIRAPEERLQPAALPAAISPLEVLAPEVGPTEVEVTAARAEELQQLRGNLMAREPWMIFWVGREAAETEAPQVAAVAAP
jgi:hypothetical protein